MSVTTDKIRVRVSSLSLVDRNPACAYARLFLGARSVSGLPALMGTANHMLRLWYENEAPKISMALRDIPSHLEIYDFLKGRYSDAVDWAIAETRHKSLSDGYQIPDQELVLLKRELYDSALTNAASLALNIRNYRSFWVGYSPPQDVHLEEEIVVDAEVDGVPFEISSHPDLFMWLPYGDSYYVIDYKTGRPASLSEWVAAEHYDQLCGYAYQIQRKYNRPCLLGAVNYTQDAGMWGMRVCRLDEERFIDVLRTVASWVHGGHPDKDYCPYDGKYCPDESKRLCVDFFGR